ncbi:hypothetical protein OG738_29875 [Amycolatopsis sp. NBC_01488]|uniref:hypothetical protein n=1 Tax=Amycolatopsis sp. NBC_01488 TaxID=2903563 RepID=UPI002E298CB6|nr:hypothetical protein [Amycolatopsis sp. NBC_01488]
MNVPAVLAALYPPAIHRRWGTEIAQEARLAGPRSWSDTVVGAVKLWLHPSEWPEPGSGETSRVLVTAFGVVITASGLLVRAFGAGRLSVNAAQLAAGVWLVPVVAGVVLAAPLLPLKRSAFGRAFAVAARTLVVPAAAVAALLLLARTGLADHLTGLPNVLVVTYYWVTLGFVGFHLCLLVARIGRVAVLPSLERLRLALLCGGTGFALGAVQALVAAGPSGVRADAVVLASGLATLAVALISVGRDLRGVPRPVRCGRCPRGRTWRR